ncbi:MULTISPECIES: sigma-70 family RNA polymerase sigma factor [Rhodanobacteraceae]|jgi:RNA polymerase sigma-70 factor (ECF subfamily)|uniref:sigma-70 family RNA polymerase sigma factor n=1 Tax=Rhodanobacteraceae TaxID=1775411 RepID=UPI00088045E3|nr:MULTISPECIES: sigma-70 family RNA polymerase sigma factor [Rhodanobacteraceae]SDF61435.1 RNA polymerase sigma-70 factor, ECF subfamily [Dyella sp. 333MFSha]SKB60462.1 RNA polymerase sigma-70 factor, ECF subfamily [Luteibacter sp. 22Crub2.1]
MPATSPAERDELNRLLQRTAAGDERAFAELYRRTSPRLFGVCVRVMNDRDEAEEVLQEAFVTVWKRAGSFDPALASAVTWLMTVARNKAIDRLRQRPDMRQQHDVDFDAMIDDTPGPAHDAENDEEYRRLRACLSELEQQQRRSIREAFFGGATYNELAERAKVPLGTMKSWIRRGLLQLRACLNP